MTDLLITLAIVPWLVVALSMTGAATVDLRKQVKRVREGEDSVDLVVAFVLGLIFWSVSMALTIWLVEIWT